MSYLDTRDLAKRLEELQEELEGLEEALEEAQEAAATADLERSVFQDELDQAVEDAQSAVDDWHDDNDEELGELENLKVELGEFDFGETMIPESEWEGYVEELCKDCGYLPGDLPHWLVIDWEATASNVAADYTTVDYQGTTYYVRYV